MIGSTTTTDENGVEVKINANGSTPIKLGITSSNEILHFGRKRDKDGNVVAGQGSLVIKQSNGSVFTQTWFPIKQDQTWTVSVEAIFNKALLHIIYKVMTEEEYKSIPLEANGDFDKFFGLLETKVLPLLKKFKYHVKLVTKANKEGKWYSQLPRNPNFIEIDNGSSCESINLNLAKDEYFAPQMGEAPTEPATDTASDPFS